MAVFAVFFASFSAYAFACPPVQVSSYLGGQARLLSTELTDVLTGALSHLLPCGLAGTSSPSWPLPPPPRLPPLSRLTWHKGGIGGLGSVGASLFVAAYANIGRNWAW